MTGKWQHYRELTLNLTLKTIKIRYKQSVFGIGWAIAQPVAMMLMFVLVFSALLKIPSDGLPYPLFAYSALLPWTLFASSLSAAVPSLEANASLMKKVYFPRELFVAAAVSASLIDFLVGITIYAGMMVWYSVPATTVLFWAVPVLAVQIIFTFGLGLLLAPINVYYRDIRVALPLILQVWLYASPIIYPLSTVPARFQHLYLLNPMAGIMNSWRDVLAKGEAPDPLYFGSAAGISIAILGLGYLVFKKMEMALPDVA